MPVLMRKRKADSVDFNDSARATRRRTNHQLERRYSAPLIGSPVELAKPQRESSACIDDSTIEEVSLCADGDGDGDGDDDKTKHSVGTAVSSRRGGPGRPRKGAKRVISSTRTSASGNAAPLTSRSRELTPRQQALFARRNLLQKAYHQVSTALKPALEELAVRTSDILEIAPEEFTETPEYKHVADDLNKKLYQALAVEEKKRLLQKEQLMKKREVELYQKQCETKRNARYIQDCAAALALLEFLQTIKDAQDEEDGDLTDDEDFNSVGGKVKLSTRRPLLGIPIEEVERRMHDYCTGERYITQIEELFEEFSQHAQMSELLSTTELENASPAVFRSVMEPCDVAKQAGRSMDTVAEAACFVESEAEKCQALCILADKAAEQEYVLPAADATTATIDPTVTITTKFKYPDVKKIKTSWDTQQHRPRKVEDLRQMGPKVFIPPRPIHYPVVHARVRTTPRELRPAPRRAAMPASLPRPPLHNPPRPHDHVAVAHVQHGYQQMAPYNPIIPPPPVHPPLFSNRTQPTAHPSYILPAPRYFLQPRAPPNPNLRQTYRPIAPYPMTASEMGQPSQSPTH